MGKIKDTTAIQFGTSKDNYYLQRNFAIALLNILEMKSEITYRRFIDELLRMLHPYFPDYTEKEASILWHRLVKNNCINECRCIK